MLKDYMKALFVLAVCFKDALSTRVSCRIFSDSESFCVEPDKYVKDRFWLYNLRSSSAVSDVLLITIRVLKAACIRCFDCNSVNNSMCLDPTIYDKETLNNFLPVIECGQGVQSGNNDFFCRKIVQTILHKHYEPEVRVTRSCGWVRHHRECYKADNEDHLETVCQCFKDTCNAASGLASAAAVVAAVIGLKTFL